jgi:hypothetical protein
MNKGGITILIKESNIIFFASLDLLLSSFSTLTESGCIFVFLLNGLSENVNNLQKSSHYQYGKQLFPDKSWMWQWD